MKLATTTGDFERYFTKHIDRVKSVHEAGFSNIDLSLYTVRENDELLLSDNWRDTAVEIKSYADDNGISFVQCHGPNVNPLRSEKDFFDSLTLTVRSLEVCALLGIPNIVMHPGWDKQASKEEFHERNREFFARLFPVMEKTGVCILHENTTKVNMPWYFPKTGAEMVEFSKYVDHPLFHSCWDTGHANCEGFQYDQIMTLGDDLYALHVNDNRGERDDHIIPYMGTLNLDDLMHALIDVGYKGVFTFESGSALRPAKYWLGNRHAYADDARLAEPPLELQAELEKFMFKTGEYILNSYDVYEK